MPTAVHGWWEGAGLSYSNAVERPTTLMVKEHGLRTRSIHMPSEASLLLMVLIRTGTWGLLSGNAMLSIVVSAGGGLAAPLFVVARLGVVSEAAQR